VDECKPLPHTPRRRRRPHIPLRHRRHRRPGHRRRPGRLRSDRARRRAAGSLTTSTRAKLGVRLTSRVTARARTEVCQFKLSVVRTSSVDILENRGSINSEIAAGRRGRIFDLDCSDWSKGLRYHNFDTRPDTEFIVVECSCSYSYSRSSIQRRSGACSQWTPCQVVLGRRRYGRGPGRLPILNVQSPLAGPAPATATATAAVQA